MSAFGELLSAITRHRGVSGCLLVSASDGIVVESVLQVGVNANAFAALSASLYRKARRAGDSAGFGEVGFFELEAEGGRVLMAGTGDLLLVTVAETRVNVGLLRVELLRAAEALA